MFTKSLKHYVHELQWTPNLNKGITVNFKESTTAFYTKFKGYDHKCKNHKLKPSLSFQSVSISKLDFTNYAKELSMKLEEISANRSISKLRHLPKIDLGQKSAEHNTIRLDSQKISGSVNLAAKCILHSFGPKWGDFLSNLAPDLPLKKNI